MHIPDGYLGPQTYAVLDAGIIPIWLVAARKVRRTLRTKQIPLMALGAAFSFVIMMFNVPVIGGSTGHAVGATLIAIILGPWAAAISVSIALVIQALVFGDGGITAIGANCLNMAVVMPFAGFYVYRLISGDKPGRGRKVAASGIAAYVAMVVAAICAGVEFGIQPLIAHTASGQPLYAPYPLRVAVPAMAGEHMLFFGILEALVTMGVVAALSRSDPALVEMKPASKPLRWLWAGIAALVLLAPVGALAQGTAWGEWSAENLKAALGFVPQGLARLGGLWRAAMPGYSTPGVVNPLVGYGIAAVAGTAIVVVSAWAVAALLARRPQGGGPALAYRTADAIGRAMSEVLDNEELAARPGLLQRLDPRVKLLSLLVFAVTASLVHSIGLLVTLVGVTLGLAAASHVSVTSFARRVWASAGLLAVLLAAPAATRLITPGPVTVPLGPLSLTAPGLLGAATLVTRVVAGAGFALLVVWTTRWTDILHALATMRVPDVVVATLALAQKQVVSLLRTVQQIHQARESRSLTKGSTGENREWVTGRMAFVARKSLKTADDVYDAMLSRGFSGTIRSVATLRVAAADGVWMVVSLAACVVVLGADRMVMGR